MNKKIAVDVNVPVAVTAAPAAATSGKTTNPAMSTLSKQYRTLSATGKALWNLANHQISARRQQTVVPDQTAIPTPAQRSGNGWTAFYSCNSALLSTQQPLISVPGTSDIPANLPPLTAVIAADSTHPTPRILLVPHSQTLYPPYISIAVWASPAAPLGNVTRPAAAYRAKQYVFLQTFDSGLPLTGLDVTDAYLSVFAAIPAACRIAFKLMAITSDGFHSELEYTFGDTPMLVLAQAASTTDDNKDEGNLHLANG